MFQGPIFDRVDAVLSGVPAYAAFRKGRLDAAGFAGLLETHRDALVEGGVPGEDVDYAKRYPADRVGFIDEALRRLRANGVLPDVVWDPGMLAMADDRQARFFHGGRSTYIYPEESGLLAAIAALIRPRRVAVLGSYYGYWAAAVVPFLEAGGRVTLVDPDPACCALAETNFTAEISAGALEVACRTGQALMDEAYGPFDLLLMDAELPRDHPDPTLRGKGVYAALLQAALPRLTPDAVLVCHNILLEDPIGCSVFGPIIARNQCELAPFKALVQQHFPNWTELASTEGVGVGRRTDPAL